ncbi:MAG: DUF3027 domain-containing protein [Ornithinimicrobium sp.]
MPSLKPDATLLAARELALAAAVEVAAPESVGQHVGVEMDAERLATHFFECLTPGYPGWRWAVSVARPPRGRRPTICETHLVPGPEALISPDWLPYVERLAPGDIGVNDRTPYLDEDPLLVPGFEATGSEDVDAVGFFELGLGRARVLSGEGRERAAQRWYDGAHGPGADVAQGAPASCSSCGFFVPLSGGWRSLFGVCANEWSPSDGTVVSLDHGCGAHSEIDVETRAPADVPDHVLDDQALDLVEH